ncbi:type III secretion system stalk subunit SctO [Noviherbaspirillum pedocola]|uniref:YscO family type III secretion system apparatus protein n=1 Tax=Noviherbaspirillum pedocola TaxID=2801341 RepID=A0A934SPS3_9BURK|nr:YscO family type III secretion system apparatus protein [Noviherbaspirillum pedocola]MBK4733250.1 YscO family type III secretion system apparatus protein [Noviherbaspirillum pedocola]
MTLNVNARYSDLLSIKKSRESAAEVKLMQAHRKLKDAVSEESSANSQLQDWSNKCDVREQELYAKLLSGGAVKLGDIDKVKFEIEGMRNDLKRKQEELKSAESRREQAEQARDEAKKSYQHAARSREKTDLVLNTQKQEQDRQQSKLADDEIDEFAEQASVKHGGAFIDASHGDGV